MKYIRYYICLISVAAAGAWLAYVYLPNHRAFLLEEDGLIENLSAFFLFASFIVALGLGMKRKGENRALFVVSAVGLLGFFDEMSYGERFFQLSMPFVAGMKIDSLHDLYELMYFQFIKVVPAYTIISYVVLTLLGAGLLLGFLMRRAGWSRPSLLEMSPPYVLILLVGLFAIVSLLIDFVGTSSVRGFEVPALTEGTLAEELLEMNIGLGLLFCSLSLYDSDLEELARTRPLSSFQLAMGAMAVTVLVVALGAMTWHQSGHGQDIGAFAWQSDVEDPRSWEYYYLQGNLLSGRGDLEEAIDNYTEALKLKPGNPAISFDLGDALLKAQHFEEAAHQFREALRAKPDFAEAYHRLGKVLFAQGELAEAVEHYRAALRIQPEFSDAHESLALALTKQGKSDEAIRHYEEAVRIIKSRGSAAESL